MAPRRSWAVLSSWTVSAQWLRQSPPRAPRTRPRTGSGWPRRGSRRWSPDRPRPPAPARPAASEPPPNRVAGASRRAGSRPAGTASRPDWSASPRCCASRPTARTGRSADEPPDGPFGQGARGVETSFPNGRGRRRHRDHDHRLLGRHPADPEQLTHRRRQSIAEQCGQHQRLVLLVGSEQPAVDVVVRPGGRRQREPGRGRVRRGQPRRLGLQMCSADRAGAPPRRPATGAAGAEQQVGRRRPPTPRPLAHGPLTHPASLAPRSRSAVTGAISRGRRPRRPCPAGSTTVCCRPARSDRSCPARPRSGSSAAPTARGRPRRSAPPPP